VRSTDYAESHFDAKAERYQRALNLYPLARGFELLPFFLLLQRVGRWHTRPARLVDALCGGGYLTSALSPCFERTLGVDVSTRMLTFYPAGDTISSSQAPIETQFAVLKQLRPDVVACLVGLHHVYDQQGSRIDREASDALQATVVEHWVRALAPHGCVIVADVADPDEKPPLHTELRTLPESETVFTQQLRIMLSNLAQSIAVSDTIMTDCPSSVGKYVDGVRLLAPQACRSRPALWFREIVNQHGAFGHADHFPRMARLRDTLHSVGLDARYFEIPTPWAFASEDALVHFFHELFAFGPTAASPEKVSASKRAFILDQADRYLGLTYDAHGPVFSGWRLGYLVVRTRHEGDAA
jgi:SAM-dependent methyltransferase